MDERRTELWMFARRELVEKFLGLNPRIDRARIVEEVHDMTSMLSAMQRERLILVLDPMIVDRFERDGSSWRDLRSALARAQNVQLVVYMPHSRGGLERAMLLARDHPIRLVLSDFDPEGAELAEALDACRLGGAPLLWHARPTAAMARVPSGLRRALRQLWSIGGHIGSADQLARRASLSRRTLDRKLRQFGFVPSGRMLQLARLCHAYTLLRVGRTVAQAVQESGYSSTTSLRAATHRAWGMPPRTAAAVLSERDVEAWLDVELRGDAAFAPQNRSEPHSAVRYNRIGSLDDPRTLPSRR